MGHAIIRTGTPSLFRTDMFHYTSFKTATFFTKHFEITFGGATEWKIHRHNLFLFVCPTLINYAPVGSCYCKSFHQCVQKSGHTSSCFKCSSLVSQASICYQKGCRRSTVCFLSVTFQSWVLDPLLRVAAGDLRLHRPGSGCLVLSFVCGCDRKGDEEEQQTSNPRHSLAGLFVSCSRTLSHFTGPGGTSAGHHRGVLFFARLQIMWLGVMHNFWIDVKDEIEGYVFCVSTGTGRQLLRSAIDSFKTPQEWK